MNVVHISHTTIYRYASEVRFGPHRMMTRPRDSHQMRVLSAVLTTVPAATLSWVYDVFGNVLAQARFEEPADRLEIVSDLTLAHYPAAPADLVENEDALTFPIKYTADEAIDLAACRSFDASLSGSELTLWLDDIAIAQEGSSMALLTTLSGIIHKTFNYQARIEGSTRHPLETFRLRGGACRDYAALFIAAARYWGIGARFVSGYLLDPNLQGAGATHAWAEVFLPDIGWVEFDPTNGFVGSHRLIRVAVAREPHQAIPISGTFEGQRGTFLGLWVGVDVTLGSEIVTGQSMSGCAAPDFPGGRNIRRRGTF
jgi:transglutaminase-like putative cysteine protease